jgi:NitT/TauT family transport system ATP-binding protein
MVRWKQAPLSPALLADAEAVYRPDLYDAATGTTPLPVTGEPSDGVGAFTGPAFDARNLPAYFAAFR